ncbi:hypothetical protein [Streptomyces erythrochromogenes]|uniref:hypothetical protein n=1 Tax=Streptomyces erythrochromogenes TaxID=285574 RepID=UPI0036BB852E
MSLSELPYEERRFLAVNDYDFHMKMGAFGGQHASRQAGHDLAGQIVFGVIGAVIGEAMDARRKRRLRQLGITPATVGEAATFHFPNGDAANGVVYAAHPRMPNSYYPLEDVHSYFLRRWVIEVVDLLRSAGADSVSITAADSVSDHELRIALELPLLSDSSSNGKFSVAGSVSSRRDVRVGYFWKRRNVSRWRLFGSSSGGMADPCSNPILATDPLIADLVTGLVDRTMKEGEAIVESSRDFGFTSEAAAQIENFGFKVGGAFRQKTSSRLAVRVTRR